jgi:hypothetical protein
MDAADGGDAPNAPVTLYRQRIGLLAAQATAFSLATQATTHEPQNQQQQAEEDSWQWSLPSLQVAAHLFGDNGRHPGFVPRDLVVDESLKVGNGQSASLPDPLPSESGTSRATSQQSGPGKSPISYLPCCTTCGGTLQPGDCLSTASVRLVRCPPISRTRRRRASRSRSKAKQLAKQCAVDPPNLSGNLLPVVSSPNLIDSTVYKSCMELSCRICRSTCYVPGVERNPHPRRKQQPQGPTTKRSPALPRAHKAGSKTDTKSDGPKSRTEQFAKASGDDRKRKSPSPATSSNLESEEFISLGGSRPLPQRVQPSNRSKKKKPNKGGSLMNFLSSLND